MIEKISATNLKGRTFTHKLGPMTMIVGPNDAGKSAIADAVRLVLLGFLPDHPKTNVGIFALCSADKLKVAASLSNGESIAREWKSKGGKVKLTEEVVGMPEMPLIALDANEYFSASDRGKVDLVFRTLRLDDSKWTPASIGKEIMATVAEVGELEDFKNNILLPTPDETVQDWLDRTVDSLATMYAESKAAAQRWEKTAQGMTALGIADAPVDIQQIEGETKAMRARLDTLNIELGKLREVANASVAGQQRRKELVRRIEEANARIGDKTFDGNIEVIRENAKAIEKIVARMSAEFEAAQKEFEGAKTKHERRKELLELIADNEPISAKVSSIKTAIDDLQKKITDAGETDSVKLEREAKLARQECDQLAGQSKAISEERKRRTDEFNMLAAASTCPTCGATGNAWKEELERKYEATIAELNSRNLQVEQRYGSACQAKDTAEAKHSKAVLGEQTLQSYQRQIGQLKIELSRSEYAESLLNVYRKELALIGENEPTAPTVPENLQFHAIELQELRDEIALFESERDRARDNEELKQLPAIDEEAEQTVYRLECAIDAINDRLEELKQLEAKGQNQLADAKRVAESQEAREKELVRLQLLKLTRDELMKKRTELVDAAMKPLLEKAAHFVAGIIPTPLEYRDGEIGRFNGSAWVPVRCFGGTHTAATFAGIQAALGATAPVKIVIVDELGRFDETNKAIFAKNIHKAIHAGIIEQFIGIDVSMEPWSKAKKEELTLIRVDTKE